VTSKVSIVIPCYNKGEYLAEAIESAFAQTWPNVEVIVVNDGSTDNSLDVARRYEDRCRLISQGNQGVSVTRNVGVRSSTGEFVICLDADDWLEPTYIEKAMKLMAEKVGIVGTGFHSFGDPSLRYSGEKWCPSEIITLERIVDGNAFHSASMFRRKAFDETGGWNLLMGISGDGGWEDWCLWVDIMKRGWEGRVVQELLLHYRILKDARHVKTDLRPGLMRMMREIHRDVNFPSRLGGLL